MWLKRKDRCITEEIDSTQKRSEIHGYYVFKMLTKITASWELYVWIKHYSERECEKDVLNTMMLSWQNYKRLTFRKKVIWSWWNKGRNTLCGKEKQWMVQVGKVFNSEKSYHHNNNLGLLKLGRK